MKRIIFIITMCCLLCGCTVYSDRIYTVCKTEGDIVYVYNEEGFFTYSNKKVKKYYGKDLKKLPKLIINIPEETDYKLVEKLPTVYTGTKEDALKYVSKLLQETNAKFQVTYCDWKTFEMYVHSDNFKLRVLYNNDNTLRLYAVNAEDKPINPPFL